MRFRAFSLAGKTVAHRSLERTPSGDVQSVLHIFKVAAVHPDGSEVGGVDDEGESIWCHTADIIRVF